MGQANLNLFFIAGTAIILLFIAGIVVFIFQYHKRKVLHDKEKQLLYEQYQTQLLNGQLDMQQQTMQHIGREIHDSVGQKLTLASLYAKQWVQSEKQPRSAEKISSIGSIIDDALSELRMLSKTLTSPMPAEDDILLLLQHEAELINKSGICLLQIDSTAPGIKLPAETKNTLFRLLQEFIQNSLKHARCRTISISFKKNENKLYITAADDGIGFNPGIRSKGIGLQNMQQRSQQLNAAYELSSSEEKGTWLLLQLPLPE